MPRIGIVIRVIEDQITALRPYNASYVWLSAVACPGRSPRTVTAAAYAWPSDRRLPRRRHLAGRRAAAAAGHRPTRRADPRPAGVGPHRRRHALPRAQERLLGPVLGVRRQRSRELWRYSPGASSPTSTPSPPTTPSTHPKDSTGTLTWPWTPRPHAKAWSAGTVLTRAHLQAANDNRPRPGR